MANTTENREHFEDEVTMIEPEAVLRFMLFRTADRQSYRPFNLTMWVDRATVLGNRYSYGKKHEFEFLDYSEESGVYVSALKPFLQRLPLPEHPGKSILALTVFLATPELFEEMEQENDLDSLEPPQELPGF
ncbi:hypothetical protein, partial [Fibrella forsythiae]